MKWINHRAITASIAFILTQNIPFTLGAYAGSTVPDRLEQNTNRDQLTFQNHRQLTHWFVPYTIVMLVLLVVAVCMHPLTNAEQLFFKVTIGGLFGCIAHIIEDGVTGTVPGLTLKSRVGKAFLKTGEQREYIISIILAIIAIIVFVLTGLNAIIQGDII